MSLANCEGQVNEDEEDYEEDDEDIEYDEDVIDVNRSKKHLRKHEFLSSITYEDLEE